MSAQTAGVVYTITLTALAALALGVLLAARITRRRLGDHASRVAPTYAVGQARVPDALPEQPRYPIASRVICRWSGERGSVWDITWGRDGRVWEYDVLLDSGLMVAAQPFSLAPEPSIVAGSDLEWLAALPSLRREIEALEQSHG